MGRITEQKRIGPRSGGRRSAVAAAVLMVLLAVAAAVRPAGLGAQELSGLCAQAGAEEATERYCNLVAQAVESLHPRLGLAVTGGNPVPGTASTLGLRLGSFPRMSLAGRITGVWAEMPAVANRDEAGEEQDFIVSSVNADAAVGLFRGFSPAPTVGGVGSIDLLASAGLVPVPSGERFDDETPFTWGLGARVGVLRESFTLPGISVSAMYRGLGDVQYGDPNLELTDAFFRTDLRAWSLRAAASKRLFTIGATAGIGWDRYRAGELSFGVANPGASGPDELVFDVDDFDTSRMSVFGNLSLTLLILHLVGELGWQSGADTVGLLPSGSPEVEDGAWFGSLALRLSI